MKPVINRKARFHYQIIEELEAGIVLTGSEVKSIRGGHIDISSAYVSISGDEIYLIGASIPRYKHAAPSDKYDPSRPRKLLLKKPEILSLKGKLSGKGLTLIALKVYTKRHRIKVSIALVKGKSKIDKRETIKKREAERKMQHFLKHNP